MTAFYLDSRGRGKDASRHTTLPRDAERAVRTLHPRDARTLELDRMTPWSAEREAEAAAVRAGIAPAPEPATVEPPEAAPELMDPAPDWSPPLEPDPTPDPEPQTDPQPTGDPTQDPTADPTGDPTATDPQPTATDAPGAAQRLGFEPQTYGDPDPQPTEADPTADAPRDPDCPCCATEARVCGRGHRYVPVTEAEARALLYMTDGAVCVFKHRRSGLPQIPLVAMASEDACAAMGMPAGSHQAAEAMVQAAQLVMQKRGAFFAEYADILGLLGATMVVGQFRSTALAGRAAPPQPEAD